MSSSSIFSKLDTKKATIKFRWQRLQIPCHYISTSMAPFEVNFMPFQLVNAPMAFVRMTIAFFTTLSRALVRHSKQSWSDCKKKKTRSLLHEIANDATYIDGMCVYSETSCFFPRTHHHSWHCSYRWQYSVTYPENWATINKVGMFWLYWVWWNTMRSSFPFSENKTVVLSSLLIKGYKSKIVWSQQCQGILNNIKMLFFSQIRILGLPNLNQTYAIQTGARKTAISCCTAQFHLGVLHTFLCVSRKLHAAKRITL